MRYTFFLLLLAFFAVPCFSQQSSFEPHDTIRNKVIQLLDTSAIHAVRYVRKTSDAWLSLNKTQEAVNLVDFFLKILSHDSLSIKRAEMYSYRAYLTNELYSFNESRIAFESSLALFDSIALKKYDPNRAHIHKNLGKIYTRFGDFQRAEIHLSKAIDLTPNEFRRGSIYNDLAIVYKTTNRLRLAEVYFEKAFSTLPPGHPFGQYILLNIGQVKTGMHQLDSAFLILKNAESFFAKYQDSSNLAFTQMALAELYISRKNYTEANFLLDAVLVFFRKKENYLNRNHIRALNQFGQNLIKQGDFKKSMSLFSEALKILRLKQTKTPVNDYQDPLILDVFYGIMCVHSFQGVSLQNIPMLEVALNYTDSIFDVANKMTTRFYFDESNYYLSGELHKYIETSIATLYELYKLTGDKKYMDKAILMIELVKARKLSEELAKAINNRRPEELAKDSFYLKGLELKYELEELRALYSHTNQANNSSVKDLLLSLANINDDIAQSVSALDFGINNRSSQSFLKDPEANYLYFFWGEESVYAIYNNPRNLGFSKVNMSPSGLVTVIDSLLSSLHDKNEDFFNLGHQLYGLLIKPLAPDSSKTLTIIPDGLLSQIPFEAFVSNFSPGVPYRKQNYLIRDFDFAYAFSISVNEKLKQFNKKKRRSRPIYTFAPLFLDHPVYSALYESKAEMMSIKDHYDVQSYLGLDATKSSFLHALNKAAVIHISTHGGQGDDLHENWLAFNGDSTHDVLHVREVFLTPTSADLIFLNACESGQGRILKGEGIINFARAFHSAGCPRVITTLWKVSQQASTLVSRSFYQHLKEKKSISSALKKAKIDYLDSEEIDDFGSHPYYWASTQLYGDADGFELASRFSHVYHLLGFVLTLALLWIWTRYRRRKVF